MSELTSDDDAGGSAGLRYDPSTAHDQFPVD